MTIFQMKDGKVEPVAIIKAGKTTKIGGDGVGRRSGGTGRAGDGARDGAGTEEVTLHRQPRRTAPAGAVFIGRGRRSRLVARRFAVSVRRARSHGLGRERNRCRNAAGCLHNPSPSAFQSQPQRSLGHLSAADRQRPDARQRVRDRRARLHDGLRDHPAHQLRARRSGDDRRDGRAHGHQRARRREHRACRRSRSSSPACWWRSRSAWRVGYTLERVAYRPLRRAPRLAPLITAIGLSIILQHLALIVWSRNPLSFPQIVEVVLVSRHRQSGRRADHQRAGRDHRARRSR